MRVIFIKDHNNFVVNNVCDILQSKANELIKAGIVMEYNGQNVEVYPQHEKEPEKEMVYVPIIVPESQLYSSDENDFIFDEEDDIEVDDKPNKTKSKLK